MTLSPVISEQTSQRHKILKEPQSLQRKKTEGKTVDKLQETDIQNFR